MRKGHLIPSQKSCDPQFENCCFEPSYQHKDIAQANLELVVLLPLLLPFQPVLLVWSTTTGWALYCLYSPPFSERHIVGALVRIWSISHRLTWWELALFPIPFCVCLFSAGWGFVLCVCCCCWGFVFCVCVVVCLFETGSYCIVLAGLKLPSRTGTHQSLPVSASQVWVTTPGRL